jgi:Leucine Rich Repeat (LRR) protein
LIRVQCAIAAMKREKPQGWGPLRSREKKLLRQHARAWLGELFTLAQKWECDRGLFSIQLKADDFLRLSEAAEGPADGWKWIYRLEIRDLDVARTARFAASPLLAHLISLDLYSSKILSTGMAALAESPGITQLTTLELAHNLIGPEGVAALIRAPCLSGLRKLTLFGNEIGDQGLAILLSGPPLKELHELHLSQNGITPNGALALAASPQIAQLHLLNLWYNQIADEGALALVNSPNLRALESLWISGGLSAETQMRMRQRFGRGLSFTTW